MNCCRLCYHEICHSRAGGNPETLKTTKTAGSPLRGNDKTKFIIQRYSFMIISVPLYSTIFIYFSFLIFFIVFFIVNIYHIVSSGILTLPSFTITFFIGALTIFTLYFTLTLLTGVDWKQMIILFDTSWFSNIFPS